MDEAHGLALWRLRALHELGTIDQLRTESVDRLRQARELAEQVGALALIATLDLQIAAGLIKQREHIRAVVEKYKDHPALLVWALGNEMEDPQGRNGAVWSQINNLARMVKEIDPAHPTMTVVA